MAAEWNDEQVSLLVDIWNGGGSASEIAPALSEAFGILFGRNAVIGKVNRLRANTNLITRASMTKDQIQAAARASEAVARIRQRKREAAGLDRREPLNNLLGLHMAKRPRNKPIPAVPVVVDVSLAKSWIERKFGECAAPVSGDGMDTMSCCARTGGKTYCAAHRAIFFVKPKDRGELFVKGVARLAA